MLAHIHHGMRYYCGFMVLEPYVAWGVARVAAEQRQRYLEQCRHCLKLNA